MLPPAVRHSQILNQPPPPPQGGSEIEAPLWLVILVLIFCAVLIGWLVRELTR